MSRIKSDWKKYNHVKYDENGKLLTGRALQFEREIEKQRFFEERKNGFIRCATFENAYSGVYHKSSDQLKRKKQIRKALLYYCRYINRLNRNSEPSIIPDYTIPF